MQKPRVIFGYMPPSDKPIKEKSVQQVVEDVGLYPPEAYAFIQKGLNFTVQRLHGKKKDPKASLHVTGQDLCEGLREVALAEWGRLARTVLRRWNITSTLDFGRIVFAMVDAGLMQKTDEDSVEDFRNVYDFRAAFEAAYQIPCGAL
jgi:uncharacterized repeat protein (TIGR04138 family)